MSESNIPGNISANVQVPNGTSDIAQLSAALADVCSLCADLVRRIDRLEGGASFDAGSIAFVFEKYFSNDVIAYHRSKDENDKSSG